MSTISSNMRSLQASYFVVRFFFLYLSFFLAVHCILQAFGRTHVPGSRERVSVCEFFRLAN